MGEVLRLKRSLIQMDKFTEQFKNNWAEYSVVIGSALFFFIFQHQFQIEIDIHLYYIFGTAIFTAIYLFYNWRFSMIMSNSNKVEWLTQTFLPAFGFVVIIAYFSRLGWNGISGDGAEWGAFGSYVSGMLSPLIAAAALIWLIKSVSMQKTELQATQIVLTKQLDQTTQQAFESLFFSLLETKNKVTQDARESYKLNKAYELFQHLTNLFITSEYNSWGDFYSSLGTGFLDSYFRINYHILKYIENSSISQKKKYADIYRATLSKFELNIIFFNCIGYTESDKYKKLVEDYGLFEPIRYNNAELNEYDFNPLTRYAYQYKSTAFEDNKKWLEYFITIEKTKGTEITHLLNCINYIALFKFINIVNIQVDYNEESPQKVLKEIFKINQELVSKVKNIRLIIKKHNFKIYIIHIKLTSYLLFKNKFVLNKYSIPFNTQNIKKFNIYISLSNPPRVNNYTFLYMKNTDIELVNFIAENKIQLDELLHFYKKL